MKHSVQAKPSPVSDSPCLRRSAENSTIYLEEVSKTYPGPNGGETALHAIDFRFSGPGLLAIVGKSGSGKSTLLNIIVGIDRPTSGRAFVGETAVHLLDETSGALWRRQHVGIVFQFFQLLPALTILENVALPMALQGHISWTQRAKRARELLARLGIESHASKLPSALSGGQQQRCAIARALANDPKLIVADEPTGNLDSATADEVIEILRQLVTLGKTVLIVTHEPEIAKVADMTITLSDGRIESIQQATSAGVKQ